jgi:2-keto-4-pentenoate hydratase/2-oxohepta-3-ene-1,7-dioic acid hydratase in catechol pathway
MRIGRLGTVGSETPVVFVDGATAVDVSSVVSDWSRETLASGAVAAVEAADLSGLPQLVVAEHRVAAPLARPGKIVCIGLNYRKHAEETNAPIPTEPVIFMKSADCLIGPFDDIEIPPGSQHTDYEVELAIVIGKQLKYAANQDEAMAAVLGYSISQDVSERHWQLEKGGTWDKGKSFPTFNPMGPWIDTDPATHPQKLDLSCSINGEVRQASNTDDMIFTIAEIVHYVSQCMELFPGDIINTGTPAGVAMGMKPPQYLKAGDVVDTTIGDLGSIRSTCVAGG